jgi:hypothetical protein
MKLKQFEDNSIKFHNNISDNAFEFKHDLFSVYEYSSKRKFGTDYKKAIMRVVFNTSCNNATHETNTSSWFIEVHFNFTVLLNLIYYSYKLGKLSNE